MRQAETRSRSVLESFGFYREAPREVRDRMAATGRVESLSPGTYYFHEVDSDDRVALVAAGSVRVFKTGRNGREITLFHVRSGQACIFNILSVLTGFRYPATSMVETPTEVLTLPGPEFRDWVAESASVRAHVLKLIGSRFSDLVELIEEVTFTRMDHRLADFLLIRFDRSDARGRSIAITHDEIARQLGTAREVVGRLLRDFEEAGAISRARGSIRLEDESRLRRYSESPSGKRS